MFCARALPARLRSTLFGWTRLCPEVAIVYSLHSVRIKRDLSLDLRQLDVLFIRWLCRRGVASREAACAAGLKTTTWLQWEVQQARRDRRAPILQPRACHFITSHSFLISFWISTRISFPISLRTTFQISNFFSNIFFNFFLNSFSFFFEIIFEFLFEFLFKLLF